MKALTLVCRAEGVWAHCHMYRHFGCIPVLTKDRDEDVEDFLNHARQLRSLIHRMEEGSREITKKAESIEDCDNVSGDTRFQPFPSCSAAMHCSLMSDPHHADDEKLQ